MKILPGFYTLLAALLLLSFKGTTQNPNFSATQNWLTGVNHNTCMQRSKEIMLKNGFSANQQSDNVSFIGSKTGYNAYLICQSCQDKVITTIVLSTSSSSVEATDLRERMLFYIATGQEGTGVPGPGDNNPVTSNRLKIEKNRFNAGEKINVQFFNTPGNSNDWISVSEFGKPETQSVQWLYTGGTRDGVLSFNGLPPGDYQVKLFYKNSYSLEDKLDFKVVAITGGDFLIKTEKMEFGENEPIKVLFSNSQGSSIDWVALCIAGSPDNQYGQWFHKGSLASGEMTFKGLPAGEYEVRYYPDNGYSVKKRINIRVVKR